MGTIGGVSGSSNAWAMQRGQHQAKMFNKVDTDSSGGVDATELGAFLKEASDKTGVVVEDTQALFQQMDSNSDGSLSSDELSQGLKQVLPPPPSTVDFAQSRGAQGDDLFSKIDSNGDGALDTTEMQAFTDNMEAGTGQGVGDRFAELDTDGDGALSQAEFEAGRPEKPQGVDGPGMAQGPRGAGGPPPAAGAPDSTTSSTDPLDTNQDGVVSELERLAGALKTLSTADSGGNEALSEVAKLAQQLYQQISTSWLVADGSSTLNTSA